MTTSERPVSDATERSNLVARLEEAQEWMREPDWAENFSLTDIAEWLNKRPTSVIPKAISEITRLAAAPAVTDEMVEAAQAKYREIGKRCNWQHSWPSEDAMREILEAAAAPDLTGAALHPAPEAAPTLVDQIPDAVWNSDNSNANCNVYDKAEAASPAAVGEVGREFWLHYDAQGAGRWCVEDQPPKIVRPDAEIIHVREILPTPSSAPSPKGVSDGVRDVLRKKLIDMAAIRFGCSGMSLNAVNDWFNEQARDALAALSQEPAPGRKEERS